MVQRRNGLLDPAYVETAETAILDYARTVKFTVTEYTFEFIVERLKNERYYVPSYQRELIWTSSKQSKFIESVFMGLPIPFVFFWQDGDGRMEIVDGSQRLRTIRAFMEDKFSLNGLQTISAANGLKFSDFSQALRYKFSETAIRAIILDNATDAETRTEMFARINTGGTNANEAEIRRGSLPGPFMKLIKTLAESNEFVELTPISASLIKHREREELVTRFFAYLESFDPTLNNGQGDIPNYKEKPKLFYYQFVKDMNKLIEDELEQGDESEKLKAMELEFKQMLAFVKTVSPYGFTKTETGNQVPRVRYETIAVGLALALRADSNLIDTAPDITPALESQEFAVATKSDAANVKSKLLTRISLFTEWFSEQ
jgi:uncharacterized protein DUF262